MTKESKVAGKFERLYHQCVAHKFPGESFSNVDFKHGVIDVPVFRGGSVSSVEDKSGLRMESGQSNVWNGGRSDAVLLALRKSLKKRAEAIGMDDEQCKDHLTDYMSRGTALSGKLQFLFISDELLGNEEFTKPIFGWGKTKAFLSEFEEAYAEVEREDARAKGGQQRG